MSRPEDLLDAFDAAWSAALQAQAHSLIPQIKDFVLPADLSESTTHLEDLSEIDREYRRRFTDRAGSDEPQRSDGGTLAEAFPDLPGFLVESIIGRSRNIVYRATQLSTRRTVAVKTIIPGSPTSELNIQRLRNEAQILGSLNHPNIVTVFSLEEHEHVIFLVMEFVDGEDLSQRVHRAPVAFRRTAEILKSAARAIHAADTAGVLHRDIKPSNILVDKDGSIRVTDFGLSRHEGIGNQLTATAEILGTPAYIAPEQAAGRPKTLTAAADIYGLGATLYHALTRRPPFVGDGILDVLDQVRHAQPLSPRLLERQIPRDLETICLKCLEKKPSHRFSTAAEFADELERFLNGEPIESRPIGVTGRGWRWCTRNPRYAVLVALVAMLLATSLVLVVERGVSSARELATTTKHNIQLKAALAREKQANEEVYDSRVRQALLEYDANQLDNVRAILDSISPAKQQNPPWEWEWIDSLLYASEWSVNVAQPNAEWVGAVAFSNDGNMLAIGTSAPLFDDRRRGSTAGITIWDLRTRKRVADLGETMSVTDLIFSEDQTTLYSAESDLGFDPETKYTYGPGRIRRWDVATWTELPLLAGGFPLEFVHIASDGRSILTAESSEAGLKNLHAFTIDGPKSHQSSFESWSPSDRFRGFIATNKIGERLSIPITRTSIVTTRDIPLPHVEIHGSHFKVTSKVHRGRVPQTSLTIRKKPEGLIVQTMVFPFIEAIAFSHDEKQLAIATNQGEIRIWDTTEWAEVLRFRGHLDRLRCMAFNRAGTRLASGDWSGDVHVWALSNPPEYRDTFTSVRADALEAFHLGHGGEMTAIIAARPLQKAMIGSRAPTASVEIAQIGKVKAPGRLADISDDGAYFVVPASNKGTTMEVRRTDTGKVVGRLPQQENPISFVRWFDSSIVLTGWARGDDSPGDSAAAYLRLYERSGRLRFSTTVPNSRIYRVAMSSDGRWLSATILRNKPDGESTSRVRTWNIASGDLLDEFEMPSWVLALEYSKDDLLFAVDFDNGDLSVRSPTTSATTISKPGLLPQLQDLAFSPDGTRLAGATRTNVTVLNVQSARPVLQLKLRKFESDYIFNPRVRFSDDGRLLMANQADGTVRTWGNGSDY